MMGGVQYNSMEQYIHAKKAELFGDKVAQGKIMDMKQPVDSRWVRVRGYDKLQWENTVRKILFDGLLAKV
ncbi:MAG: NADAR family protein [Gammaproteobacteria bacterium]|nr:NADAR family protein [Gammaproteobacteria bacterium]